MDASTARTTWPATAVSLSKVRRLCEQRGDPCTSSVYLDVDGAHRPVAATYLQAFGRLADELSRQARATGDERTILSVEGDVGAMRAWLEHGVDRSDTCGVALFSCAAEAWLDVLELDVPVHDEAAIATSPRVRQLVERLDEPAPFLVALVDHAHLRLLRVHDHHVEELPSLVSPPERAVDTSTEIGSWERHRAEAVRTHLRRAAHALDDAAGRRGAVPVVVGGPDDAVAELQRLLHPTTTSLIVGRVRVRVTAAAPEVVAAARAVAEHAARRHEADLVEELRQRVAGNHGAVAGILATLDALAQRRVALLVVQHGFATPGGRCPACGHVGLDLPRCPACGARNVLIDDVVEVAVEEAIAQHADVEFCRAVELEDFGSIAALERY